MPETTKKQTPTEATSPAPEAEKKAVELSSCEECGAPWTPSSATASAAGTGARHRQPLGPVLRRSARSSAGRAPGAAAGPQPSGARAAAVIFFVLLPIAVAVGVLVGRGGSENNDDLIAAIEAAERGAAPAGGTLAADNSATIASTYTLDKGFTVMLKTLPAAETDQAAVDAATKEAEGGGASDVGIISPADFTTKPDQAGDYVVYSGEFKTKAEADKALAKLKPKFKDAIVLEVTRAPGASAARCSRRPSSAPSTRSRASRRLPRRRLPDAQVVDDIAKKIGDDFVGAQQNLPDVIVVGGNGGGPAPTGPDN